MKSRRPISKRASKRMFTRNAVKTVAKNVSPHPMRGGIRL